MRSLSRHDALESRAERGAAGGAGAAVAVALTRAPRSASSAASPPSRRATASARENSSTAAIAKIVWRIGGEVSSSDVCRIVAAQRRAPARRRRSARRRGSARSRRRRETIASITASPSARAVASTVPATSAGRAVRTPIFQNVRQRLMPRPSEPSSQPRGTARRPSTKTATISGAIIKAEDQHAREQAVAAQRDDVGDRAARLVADDVLADERHEHEHAEQAQDHRRHAGQQPHDRLEDAPDPAPARTRR